MRISLLTCLSKITLISHQFSLGYSQVLNTRWDRLSILTFFSHLSHFIKTTTINDFSKSCQKFNFISMHKDSIYFVFYVYWRLFKKMQYSCFEAMVRKDTIVFHLYFEVRFYKWANLVTNKTQQNGLVLLEFLTTLLNKTPLLISF